MVIPSAVGQGRVEVGRGIGEDRDTAQVGSSWRLGPGRCGHDTGRVHPERTR